MRDYSVISGETLTIRRTNPRTFLFIYGVAIFGLAFPILMAFGIMKFPIPFIILLIAIILITMRIWGLLTTVTIGPNGIEVHSPLRKQFYAWNEIAVAGMYIKSRNRNMRIDQSRFNEKFIFRLKYIWLSKQPGGEPPLIWCEPNQNYCDFEFRQDAWELFDKYLRARTGTSTPSWVNV